MSLPLPENAHSHAVCSYFGSRFEDGSAIFIVFVLLLMRLQALVTAFTLARASGKADLVEKTQSSNDAKNMVVDPFPRNSLGSVSCIVVAAILPQEHKLASLDSELSTSA